MGIEKKRGRGAGKGIEVVGVPLVRRGEEMQVYKCLVGLA